jgi:hypothetical protein
VSASFDRRPAEPERNEKADQVAQTTAEIRRIVTRYAVNLRKLCSLAELTVFYCDSCMNFLGSCGMNDEGYFDALVRMFERALKAIRVLDPSIQKAFLERLEHVRHEGHNWGWGVGDDMDDLMAEYGFANE